MIKEESLEIGVLIEPTRVLIISDKRESGFELVKLIQERNMNSKFPKTYLIATSVEDIKGREYFHSYISTKKAMFSKEYSEILKEYSKKRRESLGRFNLITRQELVVEIDTKIKRLKEEFNIRPEILFLSEHQYCNLVAVLKEEMGLETIPHEKHKEDEGVILYKKENGSVRIKHYLGLEVYKRAIDKKLVVTSDMNHIEVYGKTKIR